jgi:hypothetical protein
MKKGRKTAVRLYNSQIEAEMAAVSIQGSYLEHRPAEPIRCNYFCSVNQFCNQYEQEQAIGNGP